MLANHARLMQFFAEAEDITGRKKLQKMIYILQKCDMPFQEKYAFHFYGPYSEELSLRMEELCNLGFLTEAKEEKSNYVQYRYDITADGYEFLEQFPLAMPDMTEPITLMKEKSSRFLELVSTILYFEGLAPEEIISKVHTVKPKQNYSDEELDKAFHFIRDLRALT